MDYAPPIQTFGSLRTLRIRPADHEESLSLEEKRSASVRVSIFVRKLVNLEDAHIDTWFPAEIVKSLSSHGRSLQRLVLSTVGSHEPVFHQDQWLGIEDATNLCVACPNLVELRLDLSTPQEEHCEETFDMVRPHKTKTQF